MPIAILVFLYCHEFTASQLRMASAFIWTLACVVGLTAAVFGQIDVDQMNVYGEFDRTAMAMFSAP
jgi:hypothetical protein